MKKVLICVITSCVGIASIYALSNNFFINSSNLLSTNNSKDESIISNFDSNNKLQTNLSNIDESLSNEIIELSKKTTYLLLGDFNLSNETSENYYKRHNKFLNLRYNPNVLKSNDFASGLDENSSEYKDDLVSGLSVPGMFNKMNELGINYSSFGDIRVSKTDDFIISTVYLPNVSMKSESTSDSMKYEQAKTNLVINYYFKKLDSDYKLYYLFAETTDDLNDYLVSLQDSESNLSNHIVSTNNEDLQKIYDFSLLNNISDSKIESIYNKNINNVVSIKSYYNNYVKNYGNGFIINDGIVVTTWDILSKALSSSQYITINDSNGNVHELDGIVTVNTQTDIAVLKLKDSIKSNIVIGDSSILKPSSPVFTISSKTGLGFILQKGIITSNDVYLQSSISLMESDSGSMLVNESGAVVGINTSNLINSSNSISINSEILKEIKTKFNNYDSIKTISFDDLKSNLFYTNYTDEINKNNIPSNVWKEYSKIGNIEKSIGLELIKANYKDKIISLRYKNELSSNISSMQFTSEFKSNLVNEGFKEVLNSSSKSVYRNKKYQIIIMDEFNYLIVVMVKL